jgi:uncharacterized protein YkwD
MLAGHDNGPFWGISSDMTWGVPNAWRAGLSVLAAALVVACAGDRDPPASGEPTFYRSMAASGAQVDAGAAASMISGYRQNNGLGAVSVDPALMKIAAEHAYAMASRDRLDHDLGGRSFNNRIAGSGYDAKTAYENIGAGYHTLAEAFSGWRGSPGHRANMLRRDVNHIGIAAAYAPRSKYKVFWALVLASPDDRKR